MTDVKLCCFDNLFDHVSITPITPNVHKVRLIMNYLCIFTLVEKNKADFTVLCQEE